MAIYHFRLKTSSRQKGGRAAEHMLYVAREGKYASETSISQDEFQYISREGDYTTRANELFHVEHHNLPSWATKEPIKFWQAADKHERANGRLYTELEFSLPRELDLDQRLALAREFADKTLGDRHPYTLAVHNAIASDGGEQPHVHLMFTERKLDGIERPADLFFKRANPDIPEQGGTKKDRAWSKQDKVEALRMSWEQTANAALARAGFGERIDHRSLKDQGIHREPQPRIGPVLGKLIKEEKLSRDAVIQALLKARRMKQAGSKKRPIEERNDPGTQNAQALQAVGQQNQPKDRATYLSATEVQQEVQMRVKRLEAELNQLIERRNQLGYETTNTLDTAREQARRTAQEEIGGRDWIEAQGNLRSSEETLTELKIRRAHQEAQYESQGLSRHLPWNRFQYQRESLEWKEAYQRAQQEHENAQRAHQAMQQWFAQPAQQQRIAERTATLVNAYKQQCQEREQLVQRCDLLRSHLANEQLYRQSLEVFGEAKMPFKQNELGQWMPAAPNAYIHHFVERKKMQTRQTLQRCRERTRADDDRNHNQSTL